MIVLVTDTWSTIAAERGALADDLGGLTDEQWQTRSLCDQWTVREALAHMTATAQSTPLGFFSGLASAGFSFQAFTRKGIDRNLGSSPADTLAAFRSIQSSTKAPPGPKTSWLGEAIVHAEDIRRPLGIRHDYPVDAVVECLDFYKRSNMLIGTKSRIHGLRLTASDTSWTAGQGPEAVGPALSLLMAATGRTSAAGELSGPGADRLAQR
jgi:uncharacterized protein (TIGR03083 family)